MWNLRNKILPRTSSTRHCLRISVRTLRTFADPLSLSGVDRLDCLSPSFSVLRQLWVELDLFQIAPHSVHPPQSGPSSRRYLPSHLHCCYTLCNVRVFSSHHMAILCHYTTIPRKAFLGDIMWWLAWPLHRSWTFHFWFGHEFWFCPESSLAFSSRLCASFAALLCVAPNTHCPIISKSDWW